MDALYGFVKNVIIFLILVAVITNLFSDSSYKKYISLFSGMVLILIVATPLFQFLKGDDVVSYFLNQNILAMESDSVKDEIHIADEAGKKAVFSEYEEIVKTGIENVLKRKELFLKDLKIEIDEKSSSETYGVIQEIKIIASKQEQSGEDSEDENVIESVSSTLMIRDIKDEVAELYQVDKSKINVKIM